MSERLLYESHAHTPLCKHAYGAPSEYAAAARMRGLKGIIFTCHCPLPDNVSADVRMAPEQFDEYMALIEKTRVQYEGHVDVRLGLESDFYPGVEPWLEKLHARANMHHVLGSVHPQMSHYKRKYFTGDVLAYQRLYFEHLAMAAETRLYDTLAHPDLIKNEFPMQWDVLPVQANIERALDRIAATGVAMELNTSGLYKAIPEMNPGPIILSLMRKRGIPVVLGADAHTPTRVADRYVDAMRILQEAGFTKVNYFLNRKRHEVPIKDALASLLAFG